MLSELQIYNLVLGATNDAPIDSLQDNPIVTSRIGPLLEKNRLETLSGGYAVNTDVKTLNVTIDGEVPVPDGILAVRFPRCFDYLTVRNRKVWNRNTQENYASEIKVLATLDVGLEELDFTTQMIITNLTCRDWRMQNTGQYDGKAAFYDQEARKGKQKAENRDSHNSTLATGWGRMVSVYGG